MNSAMTAGGGVGVRVSDAALETAMAAYVAYWQDDDNNKPCEECAGSGFVAVGTEGDRDYCGWCDCGYVNAGTEEGAVRAALTAAIAELIAADREYDEAHAAWGGEWYEVDNYGVDGSNFLICLDCGHASGAGLLNKGVEHDDGCMVGRLEAATFRRASALAALGESK